MSCNNSWRYCASYPCKECGKTMYEHDMETRSVPRGYEKLCPDCLNERIALLSRKQILRKFRFKYFYMLYQAVRLEAYRLRREREYRRCPSSIPEDHHWSTPFYSKHKIQMRMRIHRYVENLMLKPCTKCGSKWKLKGVCDGPDMDGPSYYVYCRHCDSGFTLDYNRGGAICIA